MFVLYAYECPILSAYTVQQSRSILSVDFENKSKMWDIKKNKLGITSPTFSYWGQIFDPTIGQW